MHAVLSMKQKSEIEAGRWLFASSTPCWTTVCREVYPQFPDPISPVVYCLKFKTVYHLQIATNISIFPMSDDVIVTGILSAKWSSDLKDVRCDLDPFLIANHLRYTYTVPIFLYSLVKLTKILKQRSSF